VLPPTNTLAQRQDVHRPEARRPSAVSPNACGSTSRGQSLQTGPGGGVYHLDRRAITRQDGGHPPGSPIRCPPMWDFFRVVAYRNTPTQKIAARTIHYKLRVTRRALEGIVHGFVQPAIVSLSLLLFGRILSCFLLPSPTSRLPLSFPSPDITRLFWRRCSCGPHTFRSCTAARRLFFSRTPSRQMGGRFPAAGGATARLAIPSRRTSHRSVGQDLMPFSLFYSPRIPHC